LKKPHFHHNHKSNCCGGGRKGNKSLLSLFFNLLTVQSLLPASSRLRRPLLLGGG
jgi:hypothetical protein